MRVRSLVVTASIASGVIVTAMFAQWLSSSSAQTPAPRYLPEYTATQQPAGLGGILIPVNAGATRLRNTARSRYFHYAFRPRVAKRSRIVVSEQADEFAEIDVPRRVTA
jgi:hypothetical protein